MWHFPALGNQARSRASGEHGWSGKQAGSKSKFRLLGRQKPLQAEEWGGCPAVSEGREISDRLLDGLVLQLSPSPPHHPASPCHWKERKCAGIQSHQCGAQTADCSPAILPNARRKASLTACPHPRFTASHLLKSFAVLWHLG